MRIILFDLKYNFIMYVLTHINLCICIYIWIGNDLHSRSNHLVCFLETHFLHSIRSPPKPIFRADSCGRGC